MGPSSNGRGISKSTLTILCFIISLIGDLNSGLFSGAPESPAPGPWTHSSPPWLLRRPVHDRASSLRASVWFISALASGVLGAQRPAAHHGPVVHPIMAPQGKDLHGSAGAGGGHLPRHLRQFPHLRPQRGAVRLHRPPRAASHQHQGGHFRRGVQTHHAGAEVRVGRRLRVRCRLPDVVRRVAEEVQGGACPAEPGESVQHAEGLPPAGRAVRVERGTGEAVVRLYCSEGQRWADEHGALTHPQQPEGPAVETDLTHQGLVTRRKDFLPAAFVTWS